MDIQSIIVAVLGVGALIGILLIGDRSRVKHRVLQMIEDIEDMLGDADTQVKYDYAVRKIQAILPRVVTLYVSDSFIDGMLESAFGIAKDIVDDGKLNNSHKKK